LSEDLILETGYMSLVKQHFLQSAEAKLCVAADLARPAMQAARMMATAMLSGHKVLVFGNGGSASDAQHFAGEMVGRFKLPNRAALPIIALTSDSAILTSVANDFSYEEVFSRQVEALTQSGDVVLGISVSGRSPNILCALNAAHERGAITIALLGGDGGMAAQIVDLALVVPVNDTTLVQECHITLIHSMCEIIELEVIAK
jgi:phosphoheptose isomerase